MRYFVGQMHNYDNHINNVASRWQQTTCDFFFLSSQLSQSTGRSVQAVLYHWMHGRGSAHQLFGEAVKVGCVVFSLPYFKFLSVSKYLVGRQFLFFFPY